MNKKYILILSLVALACVTGLFLYNHYDKKAYDYSAFYVEDIPESESDNSPVVETPTKVLSLDLLKERNPDIIGILHFPNEVIYEPIVHAPDNQYYERKNIDKKYAAAGIPFLSEDGSIQSKNLVIYGHSSTNRNIIFTSLMNYLEYDYYKEHQTFKFETFEGIKTYEIFAVTDYDTKNLDDSLEFTQSSWRKVEDFNEFIIRMTNKSFYLTNVAVSADDSIMTLVTCDTRNKNKRIIVLAKEIKNGENENEIQSNRDSNN